mmetsp:Transcript_3387/g.5698  ORF Transcript_3387/g.5698 Transcript_3387/m.5698 type:complete len:563 (-) Transcript_3387:73-1761(-)
MPHFIFYPTMKPGEFLSLSEIRFDEILERSNDWEKHKNKPLIEGSELSRLSDLTDNDIIMRQINCSQILLRLLDQRIKMSNRQIIHGETIQDLQAMKQFDFERDFYGEKDYWTGRNSGVLRAMAFVFAVIYYPYKLVIQLFMVLRKFSMLNCVVMVKRKKHQMTQCEYYLRVLKHELPAKNQNLFDFHFYKLAIFSKFASLLTQMVLDILFGILFMVYLHVQTTNALIVLHWIGQGLQLEVLRKQTEWLMGLPGGFKPNPNLSEFIGCAILDLIYLWNYMSTAFVKIQSMVIRNLAYSGLIGSTIQVALIHDALFVCSSHIFILYSVVAFTFNFILRMLRTLINLFNGKKFNMMRNRVDSNNFSLQEFYLGVLIVAIIIFLLPTLAMFYFLAFIKLIISVLGLQISLLAAQIILVDFPFHLILLVHFHKHALPNSVNIQVFPAHQNHMRMLPVPTQKAPLFNKMIQDFKKILKTSSPQNVIHSVLWGQNLIQVMRKLLQTLEREDKLTESTFQFRDCWASLTRLVNRSPSSPPLPRSLGQQIHEEGEHPRGEQVIGQEDGQP